MIAPQDDPRTYNPRKVSPAFHVELPKRVKVGKFQFCKANYESGDFWKMVSEYRRASRGLIQDRYLNFSLEEVRQ